MTREIDRELIALAKKVLNQHVRNLAASSKKDAVNFARQISRHAFREAGIDITDECSVHEDSGTIRLSADY